MSAEDLRLSEDESKFLAEHMGERQVVGFEEDILPLAHTLQKLGARGLLTTPGGEFHYRSGITPELRYDATITDAGRRALALHTQSEETESRSGMKIRITLKDPNGVTESVREAMEESVAEIRGLSESEKETICELRGENLDLSRWIDCDESVTIEIDIDQNTARVVEND